MKVKSKILACLMSICLLVPIFSSVSHAASGSVSVSSASGNVGSTVTVSATVKCSSGAIGAATVVLTYNSSGLQFVSGSGGTNGGSGSVSYAGYGDGSSTSLKFTMTFKILKEGSYSISGTADGYNWDEKQLSISVSGGSITGKAITTSSGSSSTGSSSSGSSSTGSSSSGSSSTGSTGSDSSSTGNSNSSSSNNNTTDNEDKNTTTGSEDDKDNNSKLKSLKVSPGRLSPAFSAGTKSYTVTVSEDTTSVTISASAASDKAKVTTSGGKDLKLGENAAKVVVTAEDGSTTVYNLTIVCGEVEKISVDGNELLIDEEFADDKIPTGFTKTKITYNEREYTGLKHETSGLQLLALKNDSTDSTFYILDEETQEFYPFVLLTVAEDKQIIVLEPYETEAFSEMIVLTIQGKSVDAWKIDDEFSVIRAMTMEGEEVLYKYEQVDGTLQRYSETVPEKKEAAEKEETFVGKYGLCIILALSVVIVILLIALISLFASRKQNHNARRRRMQKRLEKQSK